MPVTFTSLYANEKVNIGDIEAFIRMCIIFKAAGTEKRELRELIGFSEQEYNQWIKDPDSLYDILCKHKRNKRNKRNENFTIIYKYALPSRD